MLKKELAFQKVTLVEHLHGKTGADKTGRTKRMTDRILALEQRVSKLEVVMRTSLMYVPEEAPPGARV